MRIHVHPFAWKIATIAQLMLAATVLVVFGFAPPDRGEMLLIPLNGRPPSPQLLEQLPLVTERSGPLPGSLFVFGSSEGQFVSLLRQGVLILSAPQAICGASHSESEA
jgi:hypothetical protein